MRESHFSSEIQSVGSRGQFTNKTKMWFKVKWSTVDMNTAVVPSLSCDPGKLEKYVKFTTSPSFLTSSNQTKLTDLPDDVLLMLFQMLPPKDLICLESSCSRMRRVIVLYNAYKLRLDKIFRSKRLNNYMVLSPHAAQQKTREEISQYYKLRLYKYIHRSMYIPVQISDDDYIKLYKTEKKRQELEDLVAENRKHLTHMSLKLIL